MKKSKKKITKKVKNGTITKKTIIKKIISKDGFEAHPLSPMPYCDLIDWINNWSRNDKRFDKKVDCYVFDGVPIEQDPIDVPFAFAKLKLKWEIDRREFVVEYNKKTKTIRFTSPPDANDSHLPVGYLFKLISDFGRYKQDCTRGMQSIGGTPEQVEAIKHAYNAAIMKLEDFLSKSGDLKLDDKHCQYGNHPFTPSNSITDICEQCEDEVASDRFAESQEKQRKEIEENQSA